VYVCSLRRSRVPQTTTTRPQWTSSSTHQRTTWPFCPLDGWMESDFSSSFSTCVNHPDTIVKLFSAQFLLRFFFPWFFFPCFFFFSFLTSTNKCLPSWPYQPTNNQPPTYLPNDHIHLSTYLKQCHFKCTGPHQSMYIFSFKFGYYKFDNKK